MAEPSFSGTTAGSGSPVPGADPALSASGTDSSAPDPAAPVVISTPGVNRPDPPPAGGMSGVVGLPSSGGPVPDGSFTWGGYFQAIGILLLMLFALWFVLRFVRRVGAGRFLPAVTALPRQALRLEAQLPLGQHKGVYVVRFLNKRLVLGVTDQNITLLSETETADEEEHHANFQQVMDTVGQGDQAASPCRPDDGADSAGAGSGRS